MATVRTSKASRPLGVSINGKGVYVTPGGLKITTKGRVLEAGSLLGTLSKSEARGVRKALRALGEHKKAGAPRSR